MEELPRTAGTVLTVFDGATLHEAAVGGFDVDCGRARNGMRSSPRDRRGQGPRSTQAPNARAIS